MSQLPADCLNDIFEYLEEDKITLHSCLLVNRLWCEVSTRILWKIIRNYNTLISCLPNESKEFLSKNGIIISKFPTFNYASFCKVLSINQVIYKISWLLKNQKSVLSQNLSNIVIQEIFKLLMNQISLRKLDFNSCSSLIPNFTSYPGAKECLKDLTELCCNSNIYSEFFCQLSQSCHNIRSLNITFVAFISNGLADLISAQQNLKCLIMVQKDGCCLTGDIITSLKNLSNTLIKLKLCDTFNIPLLCIAKFTHLQEIELSFDGQDSFEDFRKLQYVTFPQLQILKFECDYPRNELLIKFLENNGKNLKEFYADFGNNSLNLAVAKFCPNLKKLWVLIRNYELDTLKKIFNSCQYLESVKIRCCEGYLNEKEIFEVFVKYSPKNFHELKLCYSINVKSKLLPEELELFFISWTNRISQKSLSLIVIHNGSNTFAEKRENMEIIDKYIKLGIIKEFQIKEFYD